MCAEKNVEYRYDKLHKIFKPQQSCLQSLNSCICKNIFMRKSIHEIFFSGNKAQERKKNCT